MYLSRTHFRPSRRVPLKRSHFTNLCSLFVACALLVFPVTLGCGGGESENGGDVATDEMGDDYEPDADEGVAEPGETEPADSEPADSEPADDGSEEN